MAKWLILRIAPCNLVRVYRRMVHSTVETASKTWSNEQNSASVFRRLAVSRTWDGVVTMNHEDKHASTKGARQRGSHRAPTSNSREQIKNDPTSETPQPLQLRLLGPFALRRQASAGEQLPKKAQALLAYVALRPGRPIPREQLANLLWGASGNEQARRSLRDCLMSLRAALGPASKQILIANAENVHLASSEQIDVDAANFEALSRSTEREQLEAACALYRDQFLAGLHITSEPFMEWILLERRRLSAIMSDVLLRLATARAENGNIETAVEAARRLTEFDPLREDGHRLLIRLLAEVGRRDAALKQYAFCTELLRRELGVTPEPATTDFVESIRKSGVVGPPWPNMGGLFKPREEGSLKSEGSSAEPGLRLPNKTSIAVLPFANLGNDPSQDYFADGIAEDVTITLGRVPWLFVIASTSASPYRGRAIEIGQIGAELGVRFVLRGSVRKEAGRMRIVVQLMDAVRGGHIWAERFEGELNDVFAIQDRVTAQVSAMIAPALQSVEIEQSQRKSTGNLTAYDLYLRALPLYRTTFAENLEALRLVGKAIELDPLYGAAYGLAARCYQFQRLFGWLMASDPRLDAGVQLARRAADIGKNDSEALWMAGITLAQLAGELDYGLALLEKSLSLNPNSASAWISSSFVLGERGDAEKALEHFRQAQRLNPLDSMHHVQWLAAGFAHFAAGRYEEAAVAVDRTLVERPTYTPAMRVKIALCGLLGQKEEGHQWVRRLLADNPDASVSWFRVFWQAPLRHKPDLLAKFLEGARRAGLPEGEQKP
ncbi:MAG TPA: BTAD domain-containing putative transcriptional regulator [Pseudolabrys sp.]|nr:BTAD domain-containing putative transcriptional regulator [Pseudolabrys sp.]